MSFYIDPKEVIRRVWPQDFSPTQWHHIPTVFRANALGDFRPEVYATPDSADLAERMRNYQSITNPATTISRSRRPVAITEIPVGHELNHWGETVWLVAIRTGHAGNSIRTEHIIVRPGTNWPDINMSELDMIVTSGGDDVAYDYPTAYTARTLDPVPAGLIKAFNYRSAGTGLDDTIETLTLYTIPHGFYYKANAAADLSSLELPGEYPVMPRRNGWKFMGWGNDCLIMDVGLEASDGNSIATFGGATSVNIVQDQPAWPVRARLHYPEVMGNMQIYEWTAEETGTPDSRIPIVDEVGIDPETGAITHVTLSQTGLGYRESFGFSSFPWQIAYVSDPTGTGAQFLLYVPKFNEATTIEVTNGGEGYTDPVFTFVPVSNTTTGWRLQSLTAGKSVPVGTGTVHLAAATPTEGNAGLYTTYPGITDKQLLNHPAFAVRNTGGTTCRLVLPGGGKVYWSKDTPRYWNPSVGVIPEGMSINEYLGYYVKSAENDNRLSWRTVDGVRSGNIMVIEVRMVASDWAPLPITLGPGDEQPNRLVIFGHNSSGVPGNQIANVVTFPEVVEPDVEEEEDPDWVYSVGGWFRQGSFLEVGYDPTELPFAIDGPGGLIPPALTPVI